MPPTGLDRVSSTMSVSGVSTRWGMGLAFVTVGLMLLLHTTGVVDLGSVIRWAPSLFILLGIVMMAASRFRRVVAPAMIIAIAAVVQLVVLGFGAEVIWPALLILIGLAILMGRGWKRRSWDVRPGTADDDMDLSTVMSSTSRRLSADDLNSGEFTTVMGESKLDLCDVRQSDLPAEICLTCVMGEVNIRVPTGWSVKINNSTVMGESKDERRSSPSTAAPDLTVTGTVVMGSLKIDD